jgi:hypothetical protein
VATVANPSSTLWTVPILDRVADERDVVVSVSSVNATMPSCRGSLFYVSAGGSGKSCGGIDGEAVELWRAGDNPMPATPGLSRDVGRVAIAVRRNGKLRLHLLSADGSEQQPLTDAVDVRGGSSWSPDQQWVVTGGADRSGDGLFKVPVDGGPPVRIAKGQALDPVWSPDGNTIVYIGPNIGSQSPLRAVLPDGSTPCPPSRCGGRRRIRARFMPDS